jgi:hypothetical protein
MLAFLLMSGNGDESAVLLSSFIGVWAFGVAIYETAVRPDSQMFGKQKIPATDPAEKDR